VNTPVHGGEVRVIAVGATLESCEVNPIYREIGARRNW